MQVYEEQARAMKAVAHPARLRILDILRQEEECVCHLTAMLGAQQPYVSKQLAILRQVGLVADRRDGMMVYYRLWDKSVAGVIKAVREMFIAHAGPGEDWPSVPSRPVPGCPCPKCDVEHNS